MRSQAGEMSAIRVRKLHLEETPSGGKSLEGAEVVNSPTELSPGLQGKKQKGGLRL